jgi:cysteine/O-acetylserine efflux protein
MPVVSMLIYACVASFTPGPNNIMSLMFANQYGFKRTVRFCFGVGTGFFALLLLSSYFNLLLKNYIPKIEFFMAIVGTVYMLYLAFIIIRSKGDSEDPNGGKYNSFIAGVCLQFVNPKAVLYALTVVSTFVLPYHTSHTSLLYYSVILAVIGFMGTFSWSIFGSLFKKFLAKYRSQFNIVMALLLVYSAVSILVR